MNRYMPTTLVLAVYLLDRLTKFWVQRMMTYGESIPVLPFFHITYVQNTGAAFGIGQNRNGFLIAASVVILIVLFVYARRMGGESMRLKASIALVIGGALGNLYDRIVYGSVVDFLDFFAGVHHWPAFNVADSSICIGAAFLFFSQWSVKPGSSPPLMGGDKGEGGKAVVAP